jgi:large subunit ribosomal protein L15
MKINELKSARGSRRPSRRVGRGLGSGRGVYSGRGRKGQQSRSGSAPRPGFEGGQTILTKRLPFRRGVRAGGNNRTGRIPRITYEPVNLRDLDRFETGAEVTPETLRGAGIVREGRVKVLGEGTLSRALTVKAHAFSKSALAAIEKAGGKAEVIDAAGSA